MNVGKANTRRVERLKGGDAGARTTSGMWGRALVRLVAAMFVLSVTLNGLSEDILMQPRKFHISTVAQWHASTLHASLRVALQVTQRQNRATASNRYSVRDGNRNMIDSRGSLKDAGSLTASIALVRGDRYQRKTQTCHKARY
jgi:hypothetical protein